MLHLMHDTIRKGAQKDGNTDGADKNYREKFLFFHHKMMYTQKRTKENKKVKIRDFVSICCLKFAEKSKQKEEQS